MADRVVPNVSSNEMRVSGLPELEAHLTHLVDDASQPFNAKLFDDVELQLTDDNIPPLLPRLLPPLTTILKSTTQDPSPLLSLTIKLLSPLAFTHTLTIADPPSILSALRSPLPGANLLALAIIHKAAASPSDAALLSTLTDIFEELVTRWLESEDVGVGEKAGKVLGDILETDCDVVGSGDAESVQTNGVNGVNGLTNGTSSQLVNRRRQPGHARIWRLLLVEERITFIIPTLCTPSSSRTERATTISQGRLLRILPRLATLKLAALAQTPFTTLFPLPPATASSAGGNGVLQWAALGMIDRGDMLMHLSLVDFFETLVSVMRVAETGSQQADEVVGKIVKTAVRGDEELAAALRGLPDRTVEEEAEPLRAYIRQLLL